MKMARWLNLGGDEDEFGLLSKFGLVPGNDAILVYPEPSIEGSSYQLEFFVHGIRHMHVDVLRLADNIQSGERLLPLLDVQNPVESCAVALRSVNAPILGRLRSNILRGGSGAPPLG